MRISSYSVNGRASFGIVTDHGIVDLAKRLEVPNLKAALAADLLGAAAAFADDTPDHDTAAGVTFLPVIPDPDHCWCLAGNYHEHIAEVQELIPTLTAPKQPAIFMRYPGTLTGHLQPLIKPLESDELDWEVELAVIIGKAGGRIAEADAMVHVAGYTAFNDGSVRDWQFHTRQIAAGKNFRATGSLGPWMVPAENFGDPSDVKVALRINGETLQDGNTSRFIHKIPKMINYLSTMLDLAPGDIIATGTPGGVGFSRKPPRFMRPGDVVEVEVGGIGILQNTIVEG